MSTNMGDGPNLQTILDRFDAMQKEIDELRGKKTEHVKITKVAVFGGFKKFGSLEDAKKWIYEKLWMEWLPQPNDIYNKGDFHGILFCKFDTEEDRDKVVQWFRKTSTKIDDEPIWSKPDALLSVRSVTSVVFEAKKYLAKWGFENFALWADPDKGSVDYKRKSVLSVTVQDDQIKIVYHGKWEQHFKHAEWTDMVGAIQVKLGRGAEKGAGKGGKAAPE